MEILGKIDNIRGSAGNQASWSGALYCYDLTYNPNNPINRTDYNYYYDINLQASRSWSGMTSRPRVGTDDANIDITGYDGSVSKPPTIAFMWILRFI